MLIEVLCSPHIPQVSRNTSRPMRNTVTFSCIGISELWKCHMGRFYSWDDFFDSINFLLIMTWCNRWVYMYAICLTAGDVDSNTAGRSHSGGRASQRMNRRKKTRRRTETAHQSHQNHPKTRPRQRECTLHLVTWGKSEMSFYDWAAKHFGFVVVLILDKNWAIVSLWQENYFMLVQLNMWLICIWNQLCWIYGV